MQAALGRLVIYTKRIDAVSAFYGRHFGDTERRLEGDRIVELVPPGTGMTLMLHPMSDTRKEGQTLVKLVFDVPDVPAFCAAAKAQGLEFGSIHQADGYCFANAKDPAKNSIQVSSRAFVQP
jgi:predicted enzyme related to lactoylglutathione lyase